jgi:syntaxin-binding protein 1
MIFSCTHLCCLCSGFRSSSGNLDEDYEYTSSRYNPQLKSILQELCNNELSLETYPSVMPMPEQSASTRSSARGGTSARSATSARAGAVSSVRKAGTGPSNRWSKSSAGDSSRSSGPTHFSGGRTIVFMIGGLSYAELCVSREVMEKESREIICGSTAFVNPSEFIDDLALLGEDDE